MPIGLALIEGLAIVGSFAFRAQKMTGTNLTGVNKKDKQEQR